MTGEVAHLRTREQASPCPPDARALHDHAVSFYDDDVDVVDDVARYVAEGLACGDRVLVVATAAHRVAVENALDLAGVDARAACAVGSYVVLDADGMLDAFMVDDFPDGQRFRTTVGELITDAGADGSPVRAFGEMVSVLWERGNVTAALELESLWNDLARSREFSLFCAYPTAALGTASLVEVGRVCDLHSSVRPPASYARPGTADPETHAGMLGERSRSEVFVPAWGAVTAARRFVADVLTSWGEGDDLAGDAALVVSELATNAMRQGPSPFRASVSRADGVARIAIEDIAPGWPRGRTATALDVDGRGLAIVEALSERSGCDPLSEGKAAWADLVCGDGTDARRTD